MGADDVPEDEAAWRRRAGAARARGDHLAAYDEAMHGLSAHPGSLPLHHAAILALARSGATRGARDQLDRLAVAGLLDAIADPALGLDFAALDGRLHKDDWARGSGAAALASASRSADAYAAAFRRYGRAYPAVNAATMMLAADRGAEALPLARAALRLAEAEPPGYWSHATAAEAAVILGEAAASREHLTAAARHASANLDEVAATRRQVRQVCRLAGADPRVIDALPVPTVTYWLDEPGPAGGAACPAGPNLIAFSALISPRDLDRASVLLEQGAEVNLVLPCELPAWTASLGPADAPAAGLLDRVIRGASSVVAVTRDGPRADPAALDLCRRQARGLAKLRAEALSVVPARLAWDPGDAPSIDAPEDGACVLPGVAAPAPAARGRIAKAIVFADVRGFSRLDEPEQLAFLDHVVGGFADVLNACPGVGYAETAGDGLYAVLDDVEAAALCCFGLRRVLEPHRVAAAGLPAHLGLRIGAHAGPVYRAYDPVVRRHKFCGTEVIRTARIEPVTPVGEVYVTEQFAAVLADAAVGDYACDYVGRQAMAKGFGTCRMYALRPAKR